MRFLTERERTQLTRKPYDLAEVGGVAMSDARLREIADKALRLEFIGGLNGLNGAIAHARKNGFDACEMIAVDARTAAVYMVNTEGCDYARYLGQAR